MKPMMTQADDRTPVGAGRYTAIAAAGVEVESAVLTRAKAQSLNRCDACYEPLFTEPHVRWCGRTAGEVPHSTQSPFLAHYSKKRDAEAPRLI